MERPTVVVTDPEGRVTLIHNGTVSHRKFQPTRPALGGTTGIPNAPVTTPTAHPPVTRSTHLVPKPSAPPSAFSRRKPHHLTLPFPPRRPSPQSYTWQRFAMVPFGACTCRPPYLFCCAFCFMTLQKISLELALGTASCGCRFQTPGRQFCAGCTAQFTRRIGLLRDGARRLEEYYTRLAERRRQRLVCEEVYVPPYMEQAVLARAVADQAKVGKTTPWWAEKKAEPRGRLARLCDKVVRVGEKALNKAFGTEFKQRGLVKERES